MSSSVIKIGADVANLFKKPTYSLGKQYLKSTFQGRKGFINFASSSFDVDNKPISGCALVDPLLSPPIRVLSFNDPIFSRDYIEKSIKDSIKYREELSRENRLNIGLNSAYRLINGEGDGLAGIHVDVFGDYLLLNTFSEFWNHQVGSISEFLLKETGKKGLYWRTTINNQLKCKLFKGSPIPRGVDGESMLVVEEDGMKMFIDLEDSFSPGIYLEHRDNRKYIADLITKSSKESGSSILLPFSHTCSFSMLPTMKQGKIQSFNIDVSSKYLNWAQKNFKLNNINLNYHKFVKQEAMGKLSDMLSKSTRFDMIVLDPPSVFKSSQIGTFTTKNHYRDLVELSKGLLNPGGFLICFMNPTKINYNTWLQHIGIEDKNSINSNNVNNNNDDVNEEGNKSQEVLEIEKLGIQEATFSGTSKISKHQNINIGFSKLKGFKKLTTLSQSPDFRYREGDEDIGKIISGVVLKNKVNFYK
eukprot:gene587-733_t